MSYHHRKQHRLRLKKHHRVLTFIAAVVLILYAFRWVGGRDWAGLWSDSHRHRWVDASPPGPSGHRR
jgi:hypothetical protein